MSSATIMVWGYQGVRGYHVTKKKEVTKATLPQVRSMNVWITELMSIYTYAESTLEEVFKHRVMATLCCWTGTKIVKPLEIIANL